MNRDDELNRLMAYIIDCNNEESNMRILGRLMRVGEVLRMQTQKGDFEFRRSPDKVVFSRVR